MQLTSFKNPCASLGLSRKPLRSLGLFQCYHPNDSWGLEGPLTYLKKRIFESQVLLAENLVYVFLKVIF